ncbi:MAG: tetratricopeptide repeat protein, partial [Bacteroidetes bacterium]|nr:tetratricopeptide repeat protein [Bacteroidota bacterium]
MRLIIAFLFFGWSTVGLAQSRIDSLEQRLTDNSLEARQRVKLLNSLGFEYWNIDSSKSLVLGNEALDLAQSVNDVPGMAKAYRILGVAHWTKGSLLAAVELLDKAQSQYQTLNDEEGIANTLLNSGMVYADLKDYDKALQRYENAINKFTALNKDGRIATTYTKMATVYLNQGNLADAKTYLDNSLAIHARNKFTYGMAEAHNRLGILFLEQNNLEQAYHHIKQSMTLGQEVDDEDGRVSNHLVYGKLLRLQENTLAANDQLKLGISLAKKYDLRKYELEGYKELKELKRAQGKVDSALFYFEQYVHLKESIFTSEKAMQVAAINFRNQIAAKDKEVSLLQEKERADQAIKWSLFVSGIGFTILCLFVIFNLRQRSKKSKELALQKHELLISKEALATAALENAQLKQQELQQKLNYKNKELTSYALNFVQKNEFFQQLEERIQIAANTPSKNKDKLLSQLARDIKQFKNIDKDWEDFRRSFEEVHTQFYVKLQEKHPNLSANDLKISSLTRLNLSVKETA